LILTWLGTLEMADQGLIKTVNKYFGIDSIFIFPELRLYAEQENPVKLPLPLPGGYWVSLLLFVNMLCGGIIRAKKGVKSLGALISHFAILFLLAGGAITYHKSQRGNMQIYEGRSSDVAEAYTDWAIEIREEGADKVHVVEYEVIEDLRPHDIRRYRLANLPFDLEIFGWVENAQPVGALESAPRKKEAIVDGYYLREMKSELDAERTLPGAYARAILKDGTKLDPFILPGASYHPFTVEAEDKKFTVQLRKQLWPMPFMVELEDFVHEYDPGTRRAANFESDIVRLEEGVETPVNIKMNEPMRYDGYTFFQASWGPQDAKPGEPLYSVFEVVKNPADKWPEWSVYVVGVGMLIQFLIKLVGFMRGSSRSKKERS